MTDVRRYSEVIDLVYRRIQFSFCDIYSFFAFSTSIIPKRFDSVQYVYFAFQDLVDPIKVVHYFEVMHHRLFGEGKGYFDGESIRCSLDYTPFRRDSGIAFHQRLPKHKIEDEATTWDVACEMLNEMKGLKSFKMTISKRRFGARPKAMAKSIYGPLKELMDRVENFDVEVEWIKRSFPGGLVPPPPPLVVAPPPVAAQVVIIPPPPPPPPPHGILLAYGSSALPRKPPGLPMCLGFMSLTCAYSRISARASREWEDEVAGNGRRPRGTCS